MIDLSDPASPTASGITATVMTSIFMYAVIAARNLLATVVARGQQKSSGHPAMPNTALQGTLRDETAQRRLSLYYYAPLPHCSLSPIYLPE
jgi:hypothetical protein